MWTVLHKPVAVAPGLGPMGIHRNVIHPEIRQPIRHGDFRSIESGIRQSTRVNFWFGLCVSETDDVVRDMVLRHFSCWALVVLAILAVSVLGQTYSAPRFLVVRGPFPVGLKVADQYDPTRVFQRLSGDSVLDGPRPLQILIWYPAKNSNSRPMTVGDYLALARNETSFERPEETSISREWMSYLAPVKDGPMQAIRNAPPKSGRDPVIIYSPSFSSVSWENADLCEYLASFGYVVIAAPAMGERTRESTHSVAGAEAQAHDVSFLLTFAQSLPNTDMRHVAAVGFSWGGLADLLAAAQDHRIDALVSLDGSERYFPGYVQESGYAKPEQMTIPLIYFEEGDQSVEAQDAETTRFHSQGPSVLNAWQHGDLMTVHMLGLFHSAFYSLSYRNKEIWKTEFKNLQVADYDYDDCLLQFSWVMRYTRAFLDAYFKRDSRAMETLNAGPRANGVPKHQMAVVVRTASPAGSPK